MKIGIYGGTFNPIHLGHLHILREFIRRLSLDRVLLIPTHVPPHKQAQALAGGEDRVAMCALAAKEIGSVPIEVSRLELQREGKSYTADTLEALKAEFPEDELFLLMGEDMFLTIHQWYRPETIFALAAICGSPRSGDGLQKLLRQKDFLEQTYGARCFVENIPYFLASSTEIRERAAGGKALSGLVPKSVEEYIHTHGLYRAEKGKGHEHDLQTI